MNDYRSSVGAGHNSTPTFSTPHPVRKYPSLAFYNFAMIGLYFFFLGNSFATVNHIPSQIQYEQNTTVHSFNETTLLAEELWATLSNHFVYLYEKGDFEKAHAMANRTHTIALNNFGMNNINTADSLLKLGIINQTLGHLPTAEDHLLSSLMILKNQLSPDHPDVAVAATNLGNVYFDMHRFRESEKYHQMALQIRQNALGESDPSVAQSLYNLAVLYEYEGLYDKAETLYQTAINSWSNSLGPTHPYVGNALGNLSNVYAAQEKYTEAANILQRALAYKKSALGPQHHEVAQTLISLGAAYLEQENYNSAGNAYAEALDIAQHILKSSDPQLALLMYTLATIYHMQARVAENITDLSNTAPVGHDTVPEEVTNAALEIAAGRDTVSHTASSHSVALLKQALPLYEKAADILDNEQNKNGPTLDVVLTELAILYKKIGNTDMAIATELRLSTH